MAADKRIVDVITFLNVDPFDNEFCWDFTSTTLIEQAASHAD